ncbi:hypothetical protein CP532_2206 [Ophiocordyceps camponoti-leonardi (nom. inval.)]|nr:hypothetical protein CP532_2206 [Ophiocordyceps camponoti-leonardi (nom. inval.)]
MYRIREKWNQIGGRTRVMGYLLEVSLCGVTDVCCSSNALHPAIQPSSHPSIHPFIPNTNRLRQNHGRSLSSLSCFLVSAAGRLSGIAGGYSATCPC